MSAIDLIHARGFHAVGVAEICERAQVQKGSFYHFFPSKTELVLAAIDHAADSIRHCVAKVTGMPGSFAEKLQSLFEEMYAVQTGTAREDGCIRGCLIGNLASELSTVDDQIRRRTAAILDEWSEALSPLVRQGVDEGVVAEDVAPGLGAAIVCYLEGVILMTKARNDPALIRRLGHAFCTAILKVDNKATAGNGVR